MNASLREIIYEIQGSWQGFHTLLSPPVAHALVRAAFTLV